MYILFFMSCYFFLYILNLMIKRFYNEREIIYVSCELGNIILIKLIWFL